MNDQKDPPSAAAAQPSEAAPRGEASDKPRPPPLAEPSRQPAVPPKHAPVYDTIESAAAKLDLDVEALRARCRRAMVRVGDTTVAKLGGGIVAFKFGRSWRLRMPPA